MASASKTPNLNLPQWVGTEKPERTDFNAAFDAIDVHLGKNPQARASSGEYQSIPSATFTFLTFTQEDFDNDNMFDFSYSDRIVCNTAGKYLIFAYCAFDGNATGVRGLYILKNNATTFLADVRTAPGVTTLTRGISCASYIELQADDFIQMQFYQNSGGAINSTNRSFSMVKVG